MVFRNKNNKTEAKFKTSTRAFNLDSTRSYFQESYYTLDGELSEVWVYANNKAYKIDKKKLTSSTVPQRSVTNRSCETIQWFSYSPLQVHSDGSFYVIKYLNFLTLCFDDETEESDSINNDDFGGSGIVSNEEIKTDCHGDIGGTAVNDPNCGCIEGNTGIPDCDVYDEIEFDKVIADSLSDCRKKLLDSIKTISEGRVAEMIKKFTGTVPHYNWRLIEVDSISMQNPTANAESDPYPKNGYYNSYLNKDVLRNASDLYVIKTMLHEAIHSYLSIYHWYDPNAANLDYPQLIDYYVNNHGGLTEADHNAMIQVLLCDLSLAIKDVAIKLGYQDGNELQQICDDLAYGGLWGTTTFASLADATKERILKRLSPEHSSSPFNNITPLGTKACQ